MLCIWLPAWLRGRPRRRRGVQSRRPGEQLEVRTLLSAPTFGGPAVFSVNEDASWGSSVGTVSAIDADPSHVLTYSILSGGDGLFAIDAMTGEITVNGPLDYETASQYVLTIEASDGQESATTTATIDINDVAEAPVFTESSYTFSVAEDAESGYSIGLVIADDPQPGDVLSYQILSGGDGLFTIDSMTGELMLYGSLDFETTNQYVLTVEASDGQHTTTATVTINVSDVAAEAPEFTAPSYTFSVDEDAQFGHSVGTVSAFDPQPGDLVTYSLVAGHNGKFSIEPMTGEIYVAGNLDYESVNQYVLTVEASDGLNTSTATVTVNINDVAEAPVFGSNGYSLAVDETAGLGQTVGFVTATDPQSFDVVAYSILTGNEGHFAIDPVTGEIYVVGSLDYETGAEYILTVEATDGQHFALTTVTIAVNPVNEAPVILDFMAICGEADTWTFQGYVWDPEGYEGMTITFGGILAGHSCTVNSDGTFSYTEILFAGQEGIVRAQATDSTGLQSPVESYFVIFT